jgi:hypothetical protein
MAQLGDMNSFFAKATKQVGIFGEVALRDLTAR